MSLTMNSFNYQLIRMRKVTLKTGKNGVFQFCGLLWNQTQPEEIRAALLQQGKNLYFSLPWQSDLSGPSVELRSELNCKQNMHFISGEVFSHFLQQKQNILLFLAGAEMIYLKSSPLLFQDQLMYRSVTRVWSLVCSKSSSFPWQQVEYSATWLGQTKRRQCAEILHLAARVTAPFGNLLLTEE